MLPGGFPVYKLAIPLALVAQFSWFYCLTPEKHSYGASTDFLDKEGSLKLVMASFFWCLNYKFLVFR